MSKVPNIKIGQFVRVRSDHPDEFRAGKDGMAVWPESENAVALVFGYDRHGRAQRCACVGPEQWDVSELDLSTL